MNSTQFWLNDPTILFNKDHLSELIPTKGNSTEENLNAISRSIIILSILGYLITLKFNIPIIGLVTLVLIAVLYKAQMIQSSKPVKKEPFTNSIDSMSGGAVSGIETGIGQLQAAAMQNGGTTYNKKSNFTNPTPGDPFMNVLLTEIVDNPTRPAGLPAFNPKVEFDINQNTEKFVEKSQGGFSNLEDRLFRDLGDNYEFSNSQRNFFATPNTRIPNDQGAFADFCYGTMISCKEGNELACARANPVLGSITGAQ